MMRLLIACLALSLLSAASRAGDGFEPLRVGQSVPAYSVRNLAGGSMRVGAGEPLTLVNIWATWCAPCRREFPAMQQLYTKYRDRHLRVLAVSVDTGGDAAVRSFVERSGATFTIGRDEAGRIQQLFKSVGVPESFLIGADGRLLWHKLGAFETGARDLQAAIDTALSTHGKAAQPAGARVR